MAFTTCYFDMILLADLTMESLRYYAPIYAINESQTDFKFEREFYVPEKYKNDV